MELKIIFTFFSLFECSVILIGVKMEEKKNQQPSVNPHKTKRRILRTNGDMDLLWNQLVVAFVSQSSACLTSKLNQLLESKHQRLTFSEKCQITS